MILSHLLKLNTTYPTSVYTKIVDIVKNTTYSLQDEEKINISKDTYFITANGINKDDIQGELSFIESQFGSEMSPIYLAKIDDLINKTYFDNIKIYSKNNSTSRILIFAPKKEFEILNLIDKKSSIEQNINKLIKKVNSIYGLNLISNKLYDIVQSVDNNGNQINNLYFKKEFVNNINKINNVFNNNYDINNKWDSLVMLQDLYNYGLKLKFPKYSDYTNYIKEDNMTEYVMTNLKEHLKLIGVVQLMEKGIHIHTSYKSFISNISKMKDNFNEYEDNLAFNITDDERDYDIKEIVKKLASSKFDFYTRPVIDDEYYLYFHNSYYYKNKNNSIEQKFKDNLDDYQENMLQFGGKKCVNSRRKINYKKKYLKYKKKYINYKKIKHIKNRN